MPRWTGRLAASLLSSKYSFTPPTCTCQVRSQTVKPDKVMGRRNHSLFTNFNYFSWEATKATWWQLTPSISSCRQTSTDCPMQPMTSLTWMYDGLQKRPRPGSWFNSFVKKMMPVNSHAGRWPISWESRNSTFTFEWFCMGSLAWLIHDLRIQRYAPLPILVSVNFARTHSPTGFCESVASGCCQSDDR